MALETLKGIKEIAGYKVIVMDKLRQERPELFNESGAMDYKKFEEEIRPNYPIQIRHDKNSIAFTLQNGPVGENGVNGCGVESLIEAAGLMLLSLNAKHPCRENALVITKLEEALHWLEHRKKDRERRGVEGFDKE